MIRKILNITGYVIFAVILVAVASLFLSSKFSEKQGIEIKIVKSGSMEPSIKTGGIVVMKPVRVYRVGDVITFGKDTKAQIPTSHRIVSERQDKGATYYTTKGDTNEEADPREVADSEILGKVIFSVPYAGYVLDFARQPAGFILLVVIPASLIVLSEIWSIIEETKKIVAKKRREKISTEKTTNQSRLMQTYNLRPRGIDGVLPPGLEIWDRLG